MQYFTVSSRLPLLGLMGLVLLFLLGGCASGPTYKDIAAQIPATPVGQGRVYFYRDGSMFGSAIQPSIRLNGITVGTSTPGGFFYIDQVPGDCIVACSTEVEQTLSFRLEAGDQRYVLTKPSFGIFVGRVTAVLEDEATAIKELANKSYTGDKFTPRKAGEAAAQTP